MMGHDSTEPPVPSSTDEWIAEINSSNPAPAGGTGGPTAEPEVPEVFIGYTQPDKHLSGWETTGASEPNMVPVTVLIDQFDEMEHWKRKQLTLLLVLGGYLGKVDLENVREEVREMDYVRLRNAYLSLLDDAIANADRRITPEALLIQAVSLRLGEDWSGRIKDLKQILADKGVRLSPDLTGEAEEEEGPHTSTQTYSSTSTSTDTSTQVSRDIMDPNDAMALTRAMMQQELGRDPTKEEMEDFIATLQYAQRTHPTRTKSTQTVTTTNSGSDTTVSDAQEGPGNSSSSTENSTSTSSSNTARSGSSTTHRGISGEGLRDIALRKIRRNPDWAEWQAVGTYAPALFQALGATVPGV